MILFNHYNLSSDTTTEILHNSEIMNSIIWLMLFNTQYEAGPGLLQ